MKLEKMIEIKEKAKFLAETLYYQNWKSANDVKKMMEQIKTMDRYEDFLTDEAGLFTVIAYSEGFEIHDTFGLWKLLEERYNALIADFREKLENPYSDDIDEDERWFATGIFKVTIYNNQKTKEKEIWIDYLCKADALYPKRA